MERRGILSDLAAICPGDRIPLFPRFVRVVIPVTFGPSYDFLALCACRGFQYFKFSCDQDARKPARFGAGFVVQGAGFWSVLGWSGFLRKGAAGNYSRRLLPCLGSEW